MFPKIMLLTTLIPIMIFGSGLSIYNTSYDTIQDSTNKLENSEKSAFYAVYSSYEGDRTGVMVKNLISDLITNADTYEDDFSKIPSLKIYDKIDYNNSDVEDAISPKTEKEFNQYVSNLNSMKNLVESKHTYNIELENRGDILEITLYY
ncbi:hypothetical protein [uncultured Clostridium sp.]|uniref:hypothetical protein n=1 Tax=uncultured Clostridium sp. TaxID=59620 RepID=UPI0026F1C6AF|nr:hypothetical protein [uncultured Clostridium sp.]